MSLGLKAELLLANSSQGATREECLNVNAKKEADSCLSASFMSLPQHERVVCSSFSLLQEAKALLFADKRYAD